MRTQFLIVANATTKTGRILVGINAASGKWHRLATNPKTLVVPAGLVVDILPGDSIEVDVTKTDKANSLIDPYTIRFTGCKPEQLWDTLAPLNLSVENGYAVVRLENQAFDPEARKFTNVSETVSDPWFLESVKYQPDLCEKQTRIVVSQGGFILSVFTEKQKAA